MQTANWTVLAFLAGDNNLEGAAIKDLNEMEVVGSLEGKVNIVAQVDRAADYDTSNDDWRSTRRYYITRERNRRKITSTLLADLGPTNTGDPRILKDFIRWGFQEYPAEHYMLVLWNHGSGFYVPPEMLVGEGAPSGREITTRALPRLRRTMFHTAREKILNLPPRERGICYDDGSNDCLDNQELKNILAYASSLLNGRKIDVVGMDACLMTMIEVAYQIKDHVKYLVGSEEVEPGDGWPYNAVLKALVDNPQTSPKDFSVHIVNQYIKSYDRFGDFDTDVTQAALDLENLNALVRAIDGLAKGLLANLRDSQLNSAIFTAWRGSTRFFDNFYIDLHQFATILQQGYAQGDIPLACQAVSAAIVSTGAASPIVAEGHLGPRMEKVKGISIYFPPFRNPSVYYDDLDFAKDTQWGTFLKEYLQ
jgi:hypothetical protein